MASWWRRFRTPRPSGGTDRPGAYGWFRRWPGFRPAARRGPAVRPFPRRLWIMRKTDSSALPFLNRGTDRVDLRAHQVGGNLEAQRVFGQQTRFAIHAD